MHVDPWQRLGGIVGFIFAKRHLINPYVDVTRTKLDFLLLPFDLSLDTETTPPPPAQKKQTTKKQ